MKYNNIVLEKLLNSFEVDIQKIVKKHIKKIMKELYNDELDRVEKHYLLKIKNIEKVHSIKVKQLNDLLNFKNKHL